MLTITRLLCWLAILLVARPQPAMSQQYYATYYVNPSGDDSNDCLSVLRPCRTIQAAVDRVPLASTADIVLSSGFHYIDGSPNYPAVNVVYWRGISIHGDCQSPDATTVRINAPGIAAITAQDYAILIVTCLTLSSSAAGNTAIVCRQIAICDYGKIHFGALQDGQHVSIADRSSASCVDQIWIDDSAAVHAGAGNGSLLHLDCPIALTAPLSFIAFIQTTWHAMITISGAQITGPGAGAATSGIQCTIQNGTIIAGNVTLPGNSPCQLYDGGILK
jgi:hypothetical protein